MRRFDKTKNILKANILAEQRYMESKGLIKEGEDYGTGENPEDESRAHEYALQSGINMYDDPQDLDINTEKETLEEEDYDTLRDLKAAGVNPNNKGDVEEYLGRELTDDEYNEMLGRRNKEYNKPTYKLDLTTKEGSPFTPTEVKAKTAKATLVKIRHNASGEEKELWVPNFVIRNNEISTSFIAKNF